jgi:hypothetical protein
MDLQTLETDVARNGRKLRKDLANDLKAEFSHVIDPAQCGSIVRRHFDGLVFALYLFIGLFLTAAMLGVIYFTVR